MKIIGAKKVVELLKRGAIFEKQIAKLKKGQAIMILKSEWKEKTPVRSYFHMDKKRKKTVKVRSRKNFHLIIKL